MLHVRFVRSHRSHGAVTNPLELLVSERMHFICATRQRVDRVVVLRQPWRRLTFIFRHASQAGAVGRVDAAANSVLDSGGIFRSRHEPQGRQVGLVECKFSFGAAKG